MSRRLRIVHILCQLNPGGAERVVLELAKRLPKERYEVAVVSTHGGGMLEQEFRDAGISTYGIGTSRLRSKNKLIRSVVVLLRLIRLLRQLKPDVVHTHLFAGDTWGRVATVIAFPGVVICSMGRGLPRSLRSLAMTGRGPILLSTEHNTNLDEGVVKRWIKWSLQFVTDRVVAVSDAVKEYSMRVDGIRAEKMVVIRHGVDIDYYALSLSKGIMRESKSYPSTGSGNNFSTPSPRIVIGCVARLELQKGHATLLDAFALLIQRKPFDLAQGINDLELWLIGDGSLRKELEIQARELGIGTHVKFFGARTDVPQLLARMDIVAQPSFWEGAGLTLLEAQAAGKPVVASRVGGTPEYVTGESRIMNHESRERCEASAILVEPGDARGLADALAQLINDPRRRQQIGEAGRKFVAERFTLERMVGEYRKLYRYCLSEVEGCALSCSKKFSPSTSSGNKFFQPTLRDAVIAVTYLCQSRCNMCSIWMNKKLPKLMPEDMRLLPTTLWNINISGGEPFLRPDLPEIVAAMKRQCPKAKIIISSNGFATKRILEHMKKILLIDPKIGVAVSLDGIGAMHDAVRGIPGGFRMCMATVRGLKRLGMKNLRLAFTAQEKNIGHLPLVAELAHELGVEFTMSAVHNSSHYFQKEDNRISAVERFSHPYEQVISSQLKRWSPKQWIRAYYGSALLEFLQTGKRRLPNYSGIRSFFLDPNRKVYPSVASGACYGELAEGSPSTPLGFAQDITSMISSQPEKTATARAEQHWMICTAREAMRMHWLSVGWWIAKEKARLHLLSLLRITNRNESTNSELVRRYSYIRVHS